MKLNISWFTIFVKQYILVYVVKLEMWQKSTRRAENRAHGKGATRIGTALPLILVCLCWALGLFFHPELWLRDWLYQRPDGPADNIFVIGIDETTLTELGPFDVWSRTGIAELVDLLMADPDNAPAVIGLDIGFYGEKDPAGDTLLAKACARAGNVVTAGAATFGAVLETAADGSRVASTRPVLLETPYPALEAASLAWGHTNINLDVDGVVRYSLHQLPYHGETIPSFAAALYHVYTGQEATPPLTGSGEWGIPYSARPYAYYGAPGSGASLSRVLSGEYPSSAFRNAIVLVGAYAQGMHDSFDTPVSQNMRMYGVEVHANILQALLTEKALQSVSPLYAALVCGGLWLLCALLLQVLRFRASIPSVALASAGYVWAAIRLSDAGSMLPLFGPLAGVLGMAVYVFALEFISMFRERRRLVTDFSRYLPVEVARHVSERNGTALQLGGVRRDIAVLFVDIRGFTSLSERMEPEALVSMLNQFLALTTACIFAQKGTVDKFIGDATMALFNAPEALPDYPLRAVQAALDMIARGRDLAGSLGGEADAQIGFGIGIHCGEAVVGNVGTEHRMEYTAIGDTVNIASRLESQAGPGEILISRAVYDQVKAHVDCTYLGERPLKGKSGPVPIWRVEGVTTRQSQPEEDNVS